MSHACNIGSECNERVLEVLDGLALMLTEHKHQWTDEERADYEMAVSILLEGINGSPVRVNYQSPTMDRTSLK